MSEDNLELQDTPSPRGPLPEAGPRASGRAAGAAARAPAARKPEEREQISDEEISAAGRSWYFVNTYSGHEYKVRHAIRATVDQMDASDRVFHVIVPTEDEIEIREGQRRTVKRKLYPGYVLIQTMTLVEGDPESDNLWHMIRNTSGVTGFVSAGSELAGGTPKPVALTQEEVNNILRAMRMEQPRVRVGFQVGESISHLRRPLRGPCRHRRRHQYGEGQGARAREHARARDPGRAGLSPGREALGQASPAR